MQSRTPSELRGAIPAGLAQVYGHGHELGKRERFGWRDKNYATQHSQTNF